jgi:HAE1 family hydrophobic/amphiphilic exporter-1
MEAKEIARLTDFKDEKKSGGETSKIVSIRIQKENTGNTVHVSDAVKEKLAVLEKEINLLYPDLRILKIADQAEMIVEAIQNVKSNLVTGALLAFVILLLFLMSIRTTLIIVVAIPVCMLITFIFMHVFHIALNVFSLSGLALASGMLVDNSITVLENIFVKKEQGMSAREASIKGTSEMTLEILTGTLTTIVVFAPIFFTDEQISMKYEGLAKTVICALITSLFAALMIVPTLSAHVKIQASPKKEFFKFWKVLKKMYRKILIFGVRYRLILAFFSVIFFLFCIVQGKDLKQELAGSTENNTFTIFVELPDGAKLEMSDTVVSEIETLLKNKELFPEIESVTANVEGWSSKIYVSVVPKIKRSRTIKELIEELRKKVPTLKTVKKTDGFVYYSEDGGEETEEVHIDVYGPEYEILKKLANETAAKMEEAPGMVDAKLAMTEGRPELWIKPKKYRAGEFGLSTQEIAEIIHAQLQGLRATAFHPKDGSGSEIETMVRLDPKYLQSLEDVKNLTIDSPKGPLLFLKDVASFEQGLSPSEIWRTNKSRMVGVSATSTQLPMEEVIPKIKEKLKGIEFPKDYYYVFSGAYYKMLEKKRQLIWALFATILLVYMVLAALFESYVQPFIIMTSVPMALIGAVLGLWFANETVTMGVFIGGILLAGISVNATIMLISSANQMREEKKYSVNRAVVTSGLNRTRPILMTSFATILGFYPMASDSSQFSVLWAPLAITVIGGNISATLMTLLVVPGLYVIFEDLVRYVKKPMTLHKFLIYFLIALNIVIFSLSIPYLQISKPLSSTQTQEKTSPTK